MLRHIQRTQSNHQRPENISAIGGIYGGDKKVLSFKASLQVLYEASILTTDEEAQSSSIVALSMHATELLIEDTAITLEMIK